MSNYNNLRRLALAAKNPEVHYLTRSLAVTNLANAASPGTILGLLDALDQLKADMGEWQDLAERRAQRMIALEGEKEALRKELDSRHPFKFSQESPTIGFTGCVICGAFTDHGGLQCPKLRAYSVSSLTPKEFKV